MNEPKRHHWWPEAHQRFWANDAGQVVCLDREGKVFASPPSGLAVIGHHNTFIMPDGTKDYEPERILGKNVDSSITAVVNKIQDTQRRTYVPALQRMSAQELRARNAKTAPFGFEPLVNFEYITLVREDRRALAKYIASMIVRVPAYRNRVSETFQRYAEVMRKIGQPIDNSQSADRNHQIGMMLKTLPTFAKALIGWTWCFIKAAPGERFIFPDDPVALNMPSGLRGEISDFSFPVLPDLILTATNGPQNLVLEGNHVFQANSEGMRTFNRNLIAKAEERVFMSAKPEDGFRSWALENFGKPAPKDILVETNGKTVRVSKKL